MMRRDLERRLRAVEVAGPGRIVISVHQKDGLVRGPRGEQMTTEEAETLWRAVGKIPVFFSEADANL
jgi:hypothetical protein